MSDTVRTFAYIDGQNLHLGTLNQGWSVDFFKLHTYLKDKYNITCAYYFIGNFQNKNKKLYQKISEAGFKMQFKKHHNNLVSNKKGNVDIDIIFHVMKAIFEYRSIKILIISGDGDYKTLVDFLIEQDRFGKILFPNRKFASSLYKNLGNKFFDFLESPYIQSKIQKLPK